MTEARPLFLCGPLADAAVLQAALGTPVEGRAMVLDGFAVVADAMGGAGVVARAGAQAAGLLVSKDAARLTHQAVAMGLAPFAVALGAQGAVAIGFALQTPAMGDWDQVQWAGQWRDVIVLATASVAARFPDPVPPLRRMPVLVRLTSQLRAGREALAQGPRHLPVPGDIAVAAFREPYAKFFSVEEYDLQFRRFDGGMSERVTRAVFVSGDAATVLPYDPVRDRVLLIEQFRAGPNARGDANPWLLEAIAGRIDPDETPEVCARREAMEEAGLAIDTMELVARHYPSPGGKTEFIYSYVAVCDLPDSAARLGGEASEAEDIKGHLVSFSDAMAMVSNGAIANSPLILTLLWLQHERARLRSA